MNPPHDPVSRPSHYTRGKFEVIEVLEDWELPFHLSNTVKYIARHEHKGKPLEDLQKARWYLDRYIKMIEVSLEDADLVINNPDPSA